MSEYIRPESLEELRSVIRKTEKLIYPLFGILDQKIISCQDCLLLDMQGIEGDDIQEEGDKLIISSGTTLESFIGYIKNHTSLVDQVCWEFTQNQRNWIKIGGVIHFGTGRSSFLTSLLALDAEVEFFNDPGSWTPIGEFLALSRDSMRQIVCKVKIPNKNIKFGFDAVRRSPADLPIVCVAMSVWKSKRVRLGLGGFGKIPLLAYDGIGTKGMEEAAKDAYSNSDDQWASSNYRLKMAGILSRRLSDSGLVGL